MNEERGKVENIQIPFLKLRTIILCNLSEKILKLLGRPKFPFQFVISVHQAISHNSLFSGIYNNKIYVLKFDLWSFGKHHAREK